MNNQGKHTAILFFSRTARTEATSRGWDKVLGSKRATSFASQLIERVKELGDELNLTVHHFHEDFQKGASFGERLHGAFKWLFSKGYQKVIAVGNDCYTLSSVDIEDAQLALDNHDIVCGETQRGGVYLLGLNAQQMNAHFFHEAPWGTKGVKDWFAQIKEQSLSWLTRKEENHFIKEWIQTILKEVNAINQVLWNCLIECVTIFFTPANTKQVYQHLFVSDQTRRGPPSRR